MWNRRLVIIVQKTQDIPVIHDALATQIASFTAQSEDDERLTLGKAVKFERVTNQGVVFALGVNLAITDAMFAPIKDFFVNDVSANRRVYELVNRNHTATYQGRTRTWFEGQLLRVFSVVNDVTDIRDLNMLDNTIWATEPATWEAIRLDLLDDFGIQIMQGGAI